MTSNQPVWKLLGSLGDVNPIDHGGMLVYEDETGVYAPEAVVIRVMDADGDWHNPDQDDPDRWIVYRFPLERCTYTDGVLSDNEFHPECPASFAESIPSVARYMGIGDLELIEAFCSDNPMDRAAAYEAIGSYHGFINLDESPVTDFDRSEMEARYGS